MECTKCQGSMEITVNVQISAFSSRTYRVPCFCLVKKFRKLQAAHDDLVKEVAALRNARSADPGPESHDVA